VHWLHVVSLAGESQERQNKGRAINHQAGAVDEKFGIAPMLIQKI
jgi:hypothetical protein